MIVNNKSALSLHTTTRPYEDYAGSSVISVFDMNLKLREGKYNIIIWKDREPDCSLDSCTPGKRELENVIFSIY